MRLPLGSRALRRRTRLLHPLCRRAPVDGTAGLRNPVSCDPVRERGDKVFGERPHATAEFFSNTDADEHFPNDDYFPDVNDLFGNLNMGENSDAAATARAVTYVIPTPLFQIMLEFVLLAFVVQVIGLSCVDAFCSSILLISMISLISIILVKFYQLLLWIKSCGILLLFPTVCVSGNGSISCIYPSIELTVGIRLGQGHLHI